MTTNLHDKMLAAIDAYFSASDGDERDQAEEQLLDVRDEINKHKRAEQPAQQEPVAWTDEQLQMLNFLYGAGEFDGVWFDQKHPTEKAAFWWRKHLRRLFDTHPQAREPLPKGEWPKHPSPYQGSEYIGYAKSDFDDYATQVLAAHGITKGNT